MAGFDLDALLKPVAADAPSGVEPDDGIFNTLEQQAKIAEQPKAQGEGYERVPPDWPRLQATALEALEQGRDLRVAATLTWALLHTRGFAGLLDGLKLIMGLIDSQWDSLFPLPDNEDAYADEQRINALTDLEFRETFLDPWFGIPSIPLVESKRLGRFCLREVLLAEGKRAPRKGEEAPEAATIDAAFRDETVAFSDLEETVRTVNDVRQALRELRTKLQDRVDPAHVPKFEALTRAMNQVAEVLAEKVALHPQYRPPAVPAEEAQTVDPVAQAETAATATGHGPVACREDVIRLLDEGIGWLRTHEPSSPVPLLLERAKRLMAKDFMGILEDLAGDGVAQAEKVLGTEGEAKPGKPPGKKK